MRLRIAGIGGGSASLYLLHTDQLKGQSHEIESGLLKILYLKLALKKDHVTRRIHIIKVNVILVLPKYHVLEITLQNILHIESKKVGNKNPRKTLL
jgi:hypothetical protein